MAALLYDIIYAKSSKFMQWCAAQSYGAYVFHLLIMLGIQFTTDDLRMGTFGKFAFIGISTAAVSFAFTWLVRTIPGMKKIL